MPVPKKRLGHCDQATRRANWKAVAPTIGTCPHCNAPKLSHTLCETCGFYRGKVISRKLQAQYES